MLKLFFTAQMPYSICLMRRKQINPTVFNHVLKGDSKIAILDKNLINFNAILRYWCAESIEWRPGL